MAEPEKENKGRRLNYEVSERFAARVDALKAELDIVKEVELMKLAYTTLEAITKLRKQGGKVIVQMPDGSVETLVFLL